MNDGEIERILAEILTLDVDAAALDDETALMGALPEFDSMAVVSILTAIEDHYGIIIDDDEVDADIFETVGSLKQFVNAKIAG